MSFNRFLYLAGIVLACSSCSTTKLLQKAAMTTHMPERFSQPPPSGLKVVMEEPGLKRLPRMANVRRTNLLVLPLLFYWQVKKNFQVDLGQDNLRYLSSNLHAAFEEELAHTGGAPKCPGCELVVQIDTVGNRLPYLDNQVSFWALITYVNYYDIHMGPARQDVRIGYSLYRGDTLLAEGRDRLDWTTELLRPAFFDGPKTFAHRYLQYYYQDMDKQLNGVAGRVVARLRKEGKL